MNVDLEKLLQLERVDREIGTLAAEVADLPKRVAEIEHQLADAKAAVEQARSTIKSQDIKKRSFEGEIQGQQQKISKFKDQSLEVKTNEQYKALMHEIQFAEAEIRKAEDKVLEIMEGAELLERQAKDTEKNLVRQASDVEKEKEHARSLTAKDEARLKELNGEREQVRSTVPGDVLSLYDRVYKARKNAIAEAREQRCTACFVLMRPQKWNELKAGRQIITCESCSRIMYYDPAHEPPPPPEPKKKKSKPAPEAEELELAATPENGGPTGSV
jgi:predicted  nucleic acid-binding Zn-ribbon protein